MDFVTVSTGLFLPYWMGLPIRYIHIDYITSILPSLQYYPSIYKFTDGKFTNELDLSEWNDLEERLINWLDKNKIN